MSTMTAFDQDDGNEKKPSWIHFIKNTNQGEVPAEKTMQADSDYLDSKYNYPDSDLGY